MTVRIFLTLLLLFFCHNISAAESSLLTGKQHWLAGEYAAAVTVLLEHRQQAYGRTAEVDYMLGTSACRIQGRQEWGSRVLNLMLYNYALDSASRQVVQNEMQRCQQTDALPAVAAAGTIGTLLVAGASGQGKMYYALGQENSLLSYPARRVRDIAATEFASRLFTAEQQEAAVSKVRTLVPNFKVHASGRFVLATQSGHQPAELDRIAAGLERYFDFLQRYYQIARPNNLVTIYLVPSPHDLRKLAEQIHGLAVNPATIGYTFRDDQSAIALVSGVKTGTLFHELFHLSVRRQFGDIPQWLDEGIASLYEVSAFHQDRLLGEPNWRGEILKRFGDNMPTLERIITSDWFPFDVTELERDQDQVGTSTMELAVHAAANRYFILYLQEQGKLAAVFQTFRDREPDDFPADPKRDAIARVEAVLQQPLADTQRAYATWLRRVLTHGLPRSAPATEVIEKELPQPGHGAGAMP